MNTSTTKPWIVLVGGFLGAGKTTLLLAAAKELERRGIRSAIILNDQSDELVDTRLAELHGLKAGVVAGGCFCCRFSEFMEAMGRMRKHAPEVIFAEPVGSCMDRVATIIAPLREYSESFQLAPYTVLADPGRAADLLRDEADAHLKFLFHKQLDEADLVCFTKADIYGSTPDISARYVRRISSKTGDGVLAWLDEIMSGTLSAGSKVLDIDYEQYARAEAALAWLNLQADIRSPQPVPAAAILSPLLEHLDTSFTTAGISIVHLKEVASSPHGYLKAAVCRNNQQPVLEPNVDFSTSSTHSLLLNLRAVGQAQTVRSIVEKEMRRLGVEVDDLRINCFHPAPPQPERRIPALA